MLTRRSALAHLWAAPCLWNLATRTAIAAITLPSHEVDLEHIAEKEIDQYRIPALSVAIGAGDAPIWTKAWGYSDLENSVRATPETVFRLASISKTFTAVAAMKLVEEGKLRLDSPVQDYVKFPKKHWPITVRQVLCHQSGIHHYRGPDFDSTRHWNSVKESLDAFARDPLEFEPGTKYLYSSYAYDLLGAIVEEVADYPYADAIRRMVLEPSGMTNTYVDDVFAIIPHRARGYRLRKDHTVENCKLTDTSNKIPAGGWLSNATDLVKYGRALLGDKLLKAQTLQLMLERQHLKDGSATGYGLGWNLAEVGGVPVYQHSGGQQGTRTHLLIAPAQRVVIAALANMEDAPTPDIAQEMLKELLESDH